VKLNDSSPAIDFTPGQAPTAAAVMAARQAAGLNQTQAAQSVGLGHYRRWGEYEAGARPMAAERFELFLLRHDLHPTLVLRARR
jgi:hypothetical protein